MFILLLLLCASAASEASPSIPKIDGVDRSGFFNYMKQEFEGRRLFVNIVDTVSLCNFMDSDVENPQPSWTPCHYSDTPSSVRSPLPAPVSIGLQASEKHPEYYGFVSRRIVDVLECVDASDADFEPDGSEPEYVLTVEESNTLNITRDEDNSRDSDALLRRVAVHAGMTKEEASKIELIDCWFLRSPEMMQINVAPGVGPRIKSGWIAERYPLGKFHQDPEPIYRYPVYLTNYSYIDGTSSSIVDVNESKDKHGKRIWTPTGWPAFARVGMNQISLTNPQIKNYTWFRETETGVLVTTLAQSMSLSYKIDDEIIEERLTLDGHHYHVSCDRKQGAHRLHAQGPKDGVNITLSSPDDSASFHCSPKRTTLTGTPELLQLDYMEQSGSHQIPASERDVSIRKMNALREAADSTQAPVNYEGLHEQADAQPVPTATRLPANRPQEDEKALTDLLLMLLFVSILAVATVICVGACVRQYIRNSRDPVVQSWISDRNGKERRRKDGHAELADASRQSIEAANKKSEETDTEEYMFPERVLPSSMSRTNSGKKKSISFAPCKKSTEDHAELVSRIDAMVAAGPDGEEEELQPLQQGAAATNVSAASAAVAAPTAAAEVVDETSDKSKSE